MQSRSGDLLEINEGNHKGAAIVLALCLAKTFCAIDVSKNIWEKINAGGVYRQSGLTDVLLPGSRERDKIGGATLTASLEESIFSNPFLSDITRMKVSHCEIEIYCWQTHKKVV